MKCRLVCRSLKDIVDDKKVYEKLTTDYFKQTRKRGNLFHDNHSDKYYNHPIPSFDRDVEVYDYKEWDEDMKKFYFKESFLNTLENIDNRYLAEINVNYNHFNNGWNIFLEFYQTYYDRMVLFPKPGTRLMEYVKAVQKHLARSFFLERLGDFCFEIFFDIKLPKKYRNGKKKENCIQVILIRSICYRWSTHIGRRYKYKVFPKQKNKL